LLAALLLFLVAGCAKQPPDIVVILIDTLRADRVSPTDDAYGLTPFLSSLARQGYYFPNVYAQSSWTNPSVATLLTSRYQSQHRITSFNSVLAPDEVTLPEILQQHGYVSGGFVANFLLRANLGFGQGFDRWQTYSRNVTTAEGKPGFIKERADRINREALAWLDEVRGRQPRPPVFLYLHYMEPHNPYDPPDADLDRVLAGRPRPDREAVNDRMQFSNLGTFTDDMVQAVKDFYDAEVISVDRALRDLFTELTKRQFLNNAIVVVVADHGEEFREHGLMGHHQTLYEEVLRVPLIILLPEQHSGVTVDPIVSLTDVAPTLLDFAGIAAPATFEGGSLRGPMGVRTYRWWPFGGAGRTAPAGLPSTGVAFSELIKEGTQRQRPHERAVVAGKEKVILDVDGTSEFYDLRADPGETNPGALSSEVRAHLTAGLADFMTHTAQQQRGAPTPKGTIDDETRERMRALGYHE